MKAALRLLSIGLLCITGLMGLSGCSESNPHLPSFLSQSTAIVGSGVHDLWSVEVDQSVSVDRYLVHWDGSGKHRFALPEKLRTGIKDYTLATAGPGTVWVLGYTDRRSVLMYKVGAAGEVVADRGADFETFEPGNIYSGSSFLAAKGGAFVTFGTTSGVRIYRFDGTKFMLMTVPMGTSGIVHVVGPDEAWGAGPFPAAPKHYKNGTWTEVALPMGAQFPGALSFAADGTGWGLGSLVAEPGAQDNKKSFISVLRFEKDATTQHMLELMTPGEGTGYGFVPLGIVAKPGGKFALLGGQQLGGPYTYQSRIVARSGDATTLARTDSSLHFFGDSCTSRCAAVAALDKELDDGTILFRGQPESNNSGFIRFYTSNTKDLP